MSKADSIPFFKPSFTSEEEEAVLRVLRSGWLTTGPETLALEKEFAAYVQSPYALAVNSATSGLLLAQQAFGVGPGDKVLTTPYTFISTATSAVHLGAEVVYADIEADGFNIDPQAIERALTQNTAIKAIIPVHIAGLPCRMSEIMDIARHYKVRVIEDAAHSFPSKTKEGWAGNLADAGVFSFYATKTITCGEGGMICLNDQQASERIKRLRSHGIDRTIWDRYTSNKASWLYDVTEAGWKCNLPDILSAIARVQLTRAEEFRAKRAAICEQYTKAFNENPITRELIETPPEGEGHAWHLYLITLQSDRIKGTRDDFGRMLQEKGISISMHFIPHFSFDWCKKRYNLNPNDFPNANRRGNNTLTLPLWPEMSKDDVNRVIEAVISTSKAMIRSRP